MLLGPVRDYRNIAPAIGFEVYVQSFPAPGGGKWQMSKNGGLFPRWRREWSRAFYYASDERLMAVPLRSATRRDLNAAVPLFEARLLNRGISTVGFRAEFGKSPMLR